MQLQQRNAVVAAAWIMAAGLIGLVGNVTSIGGAVLVIGLGLVPPIILMARGNTPVPGAVHRTPPSL